MIKSTDLLKLHKKLKFHPDLDLKSLLEIWNAVSFREGTATHKIFAELGSRFIVKGEPLIAYDVVSKGLKLKAGDVRLRQIEGLALARNGAVEKANRLLESLYVELKNKETATGRKILDGETLGILARTYKDIAYNSKSLAGKGNQFGQSKRLLH